MSHNNYPNDGKQKEVVEKSFRGSKNNTVAPKSAFAPSKAFVRAKTPSARAPQTKSPSYKCATKITTHVTQVEHHYYQSGKESTHHCQTGLTGMNTHGQQQQSQAPPSFCFRHNDPKMEHTVRCCSNESLDPCDNAERWMDLMKHGNLPIPTASVAGNKIALEMDLVQHQDCRQPNDEGMVTTATATSVAIEALPQPLVADTTSSTTIDACMFPNMFSSSAGIGGSGSGSCPKYMLMPLAPATIDYLRRIGVPSRIYSCHSALDPSQTGHLTFQMMSPSGQQQLQPQQPQRAAFAIINVNHFNFVSRLN